MRRLFIPSALLSLIGCTAQLPDYPDTPTPITNDRITRPVVALNHVSLKWGEFGYYSNWNRYSYPINLDYEFLDRLPDLREFPRLLALASDPTIKPSERAIIVSQLRTLSRCDFQKRPLYEGDDAEVEFQLAISRWRNWWKSYGSRLADLLIAKGKRYPQAWKQVAPSPYLECPQYPLLIPKTWSSTIAFRSGDYGGVTEEIIEFNVSDNKCELRRRYRTGWANRTVWTHEVWEDFSPVDAERFFAAIVYAIDNPWFFADDELSDREDGSEAPFMGSIRGRPSDWSDYYPGYEWTGILHGNQIIINHDPWNWDTIDHSQGKQTSLDCVFGVVFRVTRDLFPDPSFSPAKSRWKRVETND